MVQVRYEAKNGKLAELVPQLGADMVRGDIRDFLIAATRMT